MTTPLDIEYFIGQIYKLDEWLRAIPLTQEYREQTTYREFHELRNAKKVELGLTLEIVAQLRQVEGNKDLDWAWTEVGMTEDHRELICAEYEQDLPLNYHWMPEYEPVRKALEDFMAVQPLYQGIEEAALLEVVRTHMPGHRG